MTSAAADYPERCLHQVWEQLTARGFVIDEPMNGRCCQCFIKNLRNACCQCFIKNLRNACCQMDLLVTGTLVRVYTPLAVIAAGPARRR
jgi:hypothetical protein